jgi:paraquat-inducible protein B
MSASKEFKVGIFVIVSTALGLGSVIALGSGTMFKQTATIETSTSDSVNGLQIGSPVKYRGVPIGEVTAIAFADRYYEESGTDDEGFDFASPVVIRMKVRLDLFGPEQTGLFTKDLERGVARGLRARLTSAGLTGGLFVDLDLNDPTQFIAVMPHYEPAYPYVPSAPSKLDQLIDRIQVISRNLSQVDFASIGVSLQRTVENIDGVVNRRVDPMLADAKTFVDELRASNASVRKILDDPSIAATMADIAAIGKDVRGILGDGAGDLRTGIAEIPKLMKSAREAAEGLDKILSSPKLAGILEGLERTSGELAPTVAEYRVIGQQVQDFLASESYELRQLIEALRQTAENIQELSGSAKNDLGQTIFGDPPPRLAPGQPLPASKQKGAR